MPPATTDREPWSSTCWRDAPTRGSIRRRSTFSTPANQRSFPISIRFARTTTGSRARRSVARQRATDRSGSVARQHAGEQRRARADAEHARIRLDRLVARLGVADGGLALQRDLVQPVQTRRLVLERHAGIAATGHGARRLLDLDAICAQLVALVGGQLVELLVRGYTGALGRAARGGDDHAERQRSVHHATRLSWRGEPRPARHGILPM